METKSGFLSALGPLEHDMYDTKRALVPVYVYKMFHDNGRLDSYKPYAPDFVDEEAEFEACINGLWQCTDAVWNHFTENEQVETFYFSHPDIMEYYRLCRVYGKRFGVKLGENPFMRNAANYVRSLLNQGCYSCDYRLQTKINHTWASGIVFRMWPEFYYHFELLELMFRIFDFYTSELQKLKKALGMDAATCSMTVDLEKEAA